MPQEIIMLFGALLLLFILSAMQMAMTMNRYGRISALGPRDDIPFMQPKLTGRLQRSILNMRESLHIFTPLVLLSVIFGVSNESTVLGAQIYLAGRVVYPIVYLSGILSLRTIAFFISNIGNIMIVVGLINGYALLVE